MKILRGHFSAFNRQISEAVVIAINSGKNILNSKAEYNRCILPRLTVMMGDTEADKKKYSNEKGRATQVDDEEEEMHLEKWKERKRKESSNNQPRPKRRKRWQKVDITKRKREQSVDKNVDQCTKRSKSEIQDKSQIWAEGQVWRKSREQLPRGATASRSKAKNNHKPEGFRDILEMFRKLEAAKSDVIIEEKDPSPKSIIICQDQDQQHLRPIPVEMLSIKPVSPNFKEIIKMFKKTEKNEKSNPQKIQNSKKKCEKIGKMKKSSKISQVKNQSSIKNYFSPSNIRQTEQIGSPTVAKKESNAYPSQNQAETEPSCTPAKKHPPFKFNVEKTCESQLQTNTLLPPQALKHPPAIIDQMINQNKAYKADLILPLDHPNDESETEKNYIQPKKVILS